MKIPARASCSSRGGHGDQAENSASLQQRCWIGDSDGSARPHVGEAARAACVRRRHRRSFSSPGSAQKGAAEAPTSAAPQRTPDPSRVHVRVTASHPTRLVRACLAPHPGHPDVPDSRDHGLRTGRCASSAMATARSETHVRASPSATRQRGDRGDRPLRGRRLRQVLAHGAADDHDLPAHLHGARPDRRPARRAAPRSVTPGDVRRLARPQPAGGPAVAPSEWRLPSTARPGRLGPGRAAARWPAPAAVRGWSPG
jgi:hypothetical protein